MKPALTPEQYAIERAICDKARAYWEANATFTRGGWSTLTAEQAKHPDYAACDNAMRGRVEQYEILRDMPETIVAYVGTGKRNGMGVDRLVGQSHPITTWTGDALGNATLGASWRTAYGRLYQVYARINGREYTGRGQGAGMSVVLRETAASKRANPR